MDYHFAMSPFTFTLIYEIYIMNQIQSKNYESNPNEIVECKYRVQITYSSAFCTEISVVIWTRTNFNKNIISRRKKIIHSRFICCPAIFSDVNKCTGIATHKYTCIHETMYTYIWIANRLRPTLAIRIARSAWTTTLRYHHKPGPNMEAVLIWCVHVLQLKWIYGKDTSLRSSEQERDRKSEREAAAATPTKR